MFALGRPALRKVLNKREFVIQEAGNERAVQSSLKNGTQCGVVEFVKVDVDFVVSNWLPKSVQFNWS